MGACNFSAGIRTGESSSGQSQPWCLQPEPARQHRPLWRRTCPVGPKQSCLVGVPLKKNRQLMAL